MKVNRIQLLPLFKQQMHIGNKKFPYQMDRSKKLCRDSYVSSNQINSEIEGRCIKGTSISQSILDLINFERNIYDETGDEFSVAGMRFSLDQIPPVDENRCIEIAAKNNSLVFETGKYYKFKGQDGKTKIITSGQNNYMSNPFSDFKRDVIDAEGYEVSHFWNIMAEDPTYVDLHIPESRQRQILNDAGIKEGFFSVQVGADKREYFYSEGTCQGAIIKQSMYDQSYDMFMNREGIFDEFDVGSVFKIGGKDYVLSSDRKLDIPYGADIFDIVYPKANW